MSIQLLDLDSLPNAQDADTLKMAGIDPVLEQTIQKATSEAVERAYGYADSRARSMLDQVMQSLKDYALPKAKIMAVNVSGETRKLTKQASPYLSDLLVNAKLGLNSLLVGPAGCGKTFAAEQLAEAMGLEFGHVCLTAGASETWLFGRQTPNGFQEAPFSRLYKNGGVFLADEFDAADPNLLLAFNTALANCAMYNPISGETIPRHKDFVFIACANTFGRGGNSQYVGRSRLDASTLTRFVKIAVDYSEDVEKALCPDAEIYKLLTNTRKILRGMNAQEIISTRCLEIAYKRKASGVSTKAILESITMGWTRELIDQCGLKDHLKGIEPKQTEHLPF